MFNFKKSFAGGIHPSHYKKITEYESIRETEIPSKVIIPLNQHLGAPCESLVGVGDEVKVGQKIGESQKFVSAPVHASISGKVVAIEMREHPILKQALSIVIESDGKDNPYHTIKPYPYFEDLEAKEIVRIVKESGLVGLGGATFPTHVKLSPPKEKKIDTLIINGAECEPYLNADYRLMLEEPEKVMDGIKVFAKALKVKKAYLGIEDNKPEVIKFFLKKLKHNDLIDPVVVKTKYPQGAEKQLIKAILKRRVPKKGLPMDVGVVVQNVGTVAALADILKTGMPLVKRIVTVSGSGVTKPANLRVRIGTSFKEIIEECKGLKEDAAKVIMGGPMMGIAQASLAVPVIKGTSGILVLREKEALAKPSYNCIRCGRCVDVCPMNLLPTDLYRFIDKKEFHKLEELEISQCMECGSCVYVCPANLPIVQAVKLGKLETLRK